MRTWITLSTIPLFAGFAVAAPAPEPAPSETAAPAADSRSAVVRSLLGVLDLPVHIGDSWADAQQQLYGLRCLPEDSVLFAAMDCRSNLQIGPFSAAGPEGDGITVYSDDGLVVTRVAASRTTADEPRSCLSFQSAVLHALGKAGVPAALDRIPNGIRLRAGPVGDLQLVTECRPKDQTLELADSWVHLVPEGNCPGLAAVSPELRNLADSAMTDDVHGRYDDIGTACNRPGFEVTELAGQLMNGVMAAYTSRQLGIPEAPPTWLIDQIRGGFANARGKAAAQEPASRRRLEAFLARESTADYLAALWAKLRHNPEQRMNGRPGAPSKSSSRIRKEGGKRLR